MPGGGLCLRLCLNGYSYQSLLKKYVKVQIQICMKLSCYRPQTAGNGTIFSNFSRGENPEPPMHASCFRRSHHPSPQQIPHFQIKHGGTPPLTTNPGSDTGIVFTDPMMKRILRDSEAK